MINCRKWIAFGLLAASLFFWKTGYLLSGRFPAELAVSIQLEKGIPAARYEEMIRTESQAEIAAPFVLWTQLEAKTIFSPSGRETQTAVILARGDMQLLFSFPLALEDQTGVLIDRNTAHALFGSSDGVGAEIIYHEKKYKVRGLLNCPLPTAVFQADPLKDTELDHITLANEKQLQPFVMRHGLNPIRTIKNDVWKQLAGLICYLPPIFGSIWMVVFLVKAIRKAGKKTLPQTVVLLGLLTFISLCFFMLLTILPAQWIPSRWSNISFWSQAFSDWKKEALEWLSSQKYGPDLAAMLPGKWPCFYSISSCICLLAARLVWYKKIDSLFSRIS